MTTLKKKSRIWVYVLTPLLLIIVTLAFYQFIFQPEKVDGGILKLERTFKEHRSIVTAVRFTPDDSLIVTGSVDSTVKIWQTTTGKVVTTIMQPEGISYLDISADGNYIVTASYDAIVRIWRTRDAKLMKELKGHTGTVWTVAYSKDGKWVASSGDDKIINIWNTETGELTRTLEGHTRIVWSVKFSPDGTKLASCGFDCTIRIWDLHTTSLLVENKEHTETVVDVAFSNNGKLLASTSDDCTIRLWRMDNGALLRTMKVPEHVQAVAFSPDDMWLMTGGRDKTLPGEFLQNLFGDSEFNKGVSARLWDKETGKLLQTFSHHSNDVMDIAYSHSGKWIATASADKTADVWRLRKSFNSPPGSSP